MIESSVELGRTRDDNENTFTGGVDLESTMSDRAGSADDASFGCWLLAVCFFSVRIANCGLSAEESKTLEAK